MAKKQAKSPRKRSWPNVYSRKDRSGQVGYIVDLGLSNGKPELHSFKTKNEADNFSEFKRVVRQNQGVVALALPHEVEVDAARTSAILKPQG